VRTIVMAVVVTAALYGCSYEPRTSIPTDAVGVGEVLSASPTMLEGYLVTKVDLADTSGVFVSGTPLLCRGCLAFLFRSEDALWLTTYGRKTALRVIETRADLEKSPTIPLVNR